MKALLICLIMFIVVSCHNPLLDTVKDEIKQEQGEISKGED